MSSILRTFQISFAAVCLCHKRIGDYPRLFSIFAPQVSQKSAGSFTVAPHAVHSTVVGSVQRAEGFASAGASDEPVFEPAGMNFTIRKEIRPPIAPPASAAVTTPGVDLTPRRRIAMTTNDISLKTHRISVKARKSFALRPFACAMEAIFFVRAIKAKISIMDVSHFN